MTQVSATEKDMFLQSFEREVATTLKVLKAIPAGKDDFKPHEKSRSVKSIAWTFVQEQGIAGRAIAGKLDFSGGGAPPPAPTGGLSEAISAFEKASRDTINSVSSASDSDLSRMVQFPVGPGKLGDFRAQDVLWMTLMDQIHHRGQLSVYLRLTGGKVPSIYGPTADEPWM